MKKHYFFLFSFCLLLVFILPMSFFDLHFTEGKALIGDAKIIRSFKIDENTNAILSEEGKSFGISIIEKKFGFLYQMDASEYHWMNNRPPFQSYESENFVVIRTANNSNIHYIAVGNKLKYIDPSKPYYPTFKEVKANPTHYHVMEVKDQYAIFVFHPNTYDTETIRGFDQKGNLVADQYGGNGAMYIKRK